MIIPAVARIAELKVHQKWSRRHAGSPAGRAIAANRGGLTVDEKRRKQQGFRNSKKNGIPNNTPNHTRIIPDSCFQLRKSEPWYICKIRTCVL